MKILFIGSDSPDYQNDCVLHGLKTLYKSDVVDIPKKISMYNDKNSANNIYGNGFTIFKTIENEPTNRHNIKERILNREFDLVIYGSITRNSDFISDVASCYPKERIVFIDGRELVIKSIHDWAKENGYSKAAIRNVHIRKWTKTKDIISVEVFNDNLKSSKQIVSEYEEKTSNPNWGKMSDEVKNKLSKERMGTNNKSSKWWKITFDDGRIIERCGLDNWCKENGYDRRLLSRVKNKQHKKHKDIVAVEEVSQDAL